MSLIAVVVCHLNSAIKEHSCKVTTESCNISKTMMWIFRYILARELYNQYSENRTAIWSLLSLENLGRLSWNIIFIFIIVLMTIAFAQRNNVVYSDLQAGDSLYLQPEGYFSKNEVPVYNKLLKESDYSGTLTDVIDTIFHYQFSHKIDSIKFASGKYPVGIYSGQYFKTKDGDELIGFKRFEEIKLDEPEWSDFNYKKENKYNKAEFIDLDLVKISTTKDPESRWFFFFVAALVAYFSLGKFLRSFFRLFKKKIPVYSREPIYKRDNRYKSGQRIVRYKSVITDYRPMTDQELDIHKKQQKSKFIFSTVLLLLSCSYIYSLFL